MGGITIVQTTQSASSRARIAALKDSHGYPVHIRGYDAGSVVDRVIQCHAVQDALIAGDRLASDSSRFRRPCPCRRVQHE